jgi:hypothetical protein
MLEGVFVGSFGYLSDTDTVSLLTTLMLEMFYVFYKALRKEYLNIDECRQQKAVFFCSKYFLMYFNCNIFTNNLKPV